MILNCCLLVLYVLLVVCLFVFINFFCCHVAGEAVEGGGRGGRGWGGVRLKPGLFGSWLLYFSRENPL